MKNITSITGGALIDNCKKKKDTEISFKKVSLIALLKKIFFTIFLQFLNSRLIFPFFFLFLRYAHKKNLIFFLQKYRTDFVVSLKNSIPEDFLKTMSNFQCFLLINQFDSVEKNNLIRIRNSQYLYKKLKNNNNIIFPQLNFTNCNIFIDFPIICSNKLYKEKIWNRSLINFIDIKNYYYTDTVSQKCYSKYNNPEVFFNSKTIADNILMLPVNINQRQNDLDKIVSLFNE
jgi:hypothetical protein